MGGRGMGIQSLQLNVHYTDGVYVNESTKELVMATDGLRIHYTPKFRPYSSVGKELINIALGPEQLTIPPGESRFYVSRTCEVRSNCKDAGEDHMRFLEQLSGVEAGEFGSCKDLQHQCDLGNIQRLCPETCGFCDGDGASNPFNPDFYRLTAVHYHAHLLGRQMYTTMIRDVDNGEPEIKDIESRDFWIYDFQEVIPLEYEVIENDAIMPGTHIRPGDKFQASCVYDSMYRTESTQFDESTYDEMCITSAYITFLTPKSLLEGSTTASLDLQTQLRLLSFSCVDDDRADVYTGILGPYEDGRDIWRDHPLETAEGCTFPTTMFYGDGLTRETRNCADNEDSSSTNEAEVEVEAEAEAEAEAELVEEYEESQGGEASSSASNRLPSVLATVAVLLAVVLG